MTIVSRWSPLPPRWKSRTMQHNMHNCWQQACYCQHLPTMREMILLEGCLHTSLGCSCAMLQTFAKCWRLMKVAGCYRSCVLCKHDQFRSSPRAWQTNNKALVGKAPEGSLPMSAWEKKIWLQETDVRSCQIMSDHVRSYQIMSDHVGSCSTVLLPNHGPIPAEQRARIIIINYLILWLWRLWCIQDYDDDAYRITHIPFPYCTWKHATREAVERVATFATSEAHSARMCVCESISCTNVNLK